MKKQKRLRELAVPPAPVPIAVASAAPLRIDLGCGPNKRQDNGPWTGVDSIAFPGVEIVADLTKSWPFANDSVTEIHASHFLEHLTNFEGKWERVHFFNEMDRVLIPGGKATLIFPHWCSNRYYGDPTHKEPFSEMGFYYLDRNWRLGDPSKGIPGNAPHADKSFNPHGYSCHLNATWGYIPHEAIKLRHQEAQQFAFNFYKEAILDIVATVTKPDK